MFKTLISGVKAMTAVAAFVLAFTVSASAQDRSANGAQKLTDKMKTELTLNDDQYAKVLDINKSFSEKTAEARKASADRKETAKAIKGFNEERDAKLKTVLTEDQFKKYVANKEAQKALLKQRMASRKDAPKLQAAPVKGQ